MQKTNGNWNPDEPFVYFGAGPLQHLTIAGTYHKPCLIAANELMRETWRESLDLFLEENRVILIDSGAFGIAAEHARKHDIPLEDAFKMPLKQLGGFDALWDRYLEVIQDYGDKVWGIIEMDLGGEAKKRILRKSMEDLGHHPIPVFHPMGDSAEYLDELLDGYDRICIGNLVSASRYARKRILKTISDRRQGKKCRWIHLLGVTPSEMLCAFPFESCDSSAWQNTIRWSGYVEKSCLKSVGFLPKHFQYQLGDKDSWSLGVQMGAIGAAFQQRNLRHYLKAVPHG